MYVCVDLTPHPTDLQSLGHLQEELEGYRTSHPGPPWHTSLRGPHRLGTLTARTRPNDIFNGHLDNRAGHVRSTVRDERHDHCPHRSSY